MCWQEKDTDEEEIQNEFYDQIVSYSFRRIVRVAVDVVEQNKCIFQGHMSAQKGRCVRHIHIEGRNDRPTVKKR